MKLIKISIFAPVLDKTGTSLTLFIAQWNCGVVVISCSYCLRENFVENYATQHHQIGKTQDRFGNTQVLEQQMRKTRFSRLFSGR